MTSETLHTFKRCLARKYKMLRSGKLYGAIDKYLVTVLYYTVAVDVITDLPKQLSPYEYFEFRKANKALIVTATRV